MLLTNTPKRERVSCCCWKMAIFFFRFQNAIWNYHRCRSVGWPLRSFDGWSCRVECVDFSSSLAQDTHGATPRTDAIVSEWSIDTFGGSNLLSGFGCFVNGDDRANQRPVPEATAFDCAAWFHCLHDFAIGETWAKVSDSASFAVGKTTEQSSRPIGHCCQLILF